MKPAPTHCSLQNASAACLVFILRVALSHISTHPVLFWLTQGDIHTPFLNVESISCNCKLKSILIFSNHLWAKTCFISSLSHQFISLPVFTLGFLFDKIHIPLSKRSLKSMCFNDNPVCCYSRGPCPHSCCSCHY